MLFSGTYLSGCKTPIEPVAGHYKNPILPFSLGLNLLLFFRQRFLKYPVGVYTDRSNDGKVLKSRWNFVKTKSTTPSNNIYTLIITCRLFFSSKFSTLYFPYKLSYYAWATCDATTIKTKRSNKFSQWYSVYKLRIKREFHHIHFWKRPFPSAKNQDVLWLFSFLLYK